MPSQSLLSNTTSSHNHDSAACAVVHSLVHAEPGSKDRYSVSRRVYLSCALTKRRRLSIDSQLLIQIMMAWDLRRAQAAYQVSNILERIYKYERFCFVLHPLIPNLPAT
jgi:hypothetical protein